MGGASVEIEVSPLLSFNFLRLPPPDSGHDWCLAVEAVVITFQTEGWLVGVQPAGALEPFGVKKDAAGEERVAALG